MSAFEATMTRLIETNTARVHRRGEPRLRRKTFSRFLIAVATGSVLSTSLLAQPKPTLAQAGTLSAQSRNGAMGASAAATALGAAPCGRVEIAPAVQVSVGKSTVLRPGSPVRRVLLGNPEGSHAARP